MFAFANMTDASVELWVADARTAKARRIDGIALNPVLGYTYNWLPDRKTLVVKTVPADRAAPPKEAPAPLGPHIEESGAVRAASSTYEARDLLKTPYDADLFEYYGTAQVALVDTSNGAVTRVGPPDVITKVQPAPGGAYLLVERVHRLYIYTRPFNRFPLDVEVWDLEGNHWYTVTLLDAGDRSVAPRRVSSLSSDDRYNDPGNPVYTVLPSGAYAVREHKGAIFMAGEGASPRGNRPFIDRLDLGTLKTERWFRSSPDALETFLGWIDPASRRFLTRRESVTDPPNVYLRSLGGKAAKSEAGEAGYKSTAKQITKFADPTPQLRRISKRLVTYERPDGVNLSFTLYLPPGYKEGTRLGVGGHSHGALMTANLIAWSDLFRAGIARSGAYNHTLRPFGFQNERRTLYKAKDTYVRLSPLLNADKIDEPLLIIHGERDANPGMVPMQSEKLFEAVRGAGGQTRLVMLPLESHGYTARESIDHVLYEMVSWMETYVKNAAPREATK